jgi:hypothetical protein
VDGQVFSQSGFAVSPVLGQDSKSDLFQSCSVHYLVGGTNVSRSGVKRILVIHKEA